MTKIEYSFSERNAWMWQARQLLDITFYPCLSYKERWVVLDKSKGSVYINRNNHIDVVMQTVTIEDGIHSLTIDEKIDRKLRNTIFCETTSMKEFGKPGWMVKGVSQADLLLWAFVTKRPSGFKIYMFYLPLLIEWFWDNILRFRRFEIKNNELGRRWTTVGRSVPIKYIPKHIFFVDGMLIRRQIGLFDI